VPLANLHASNGVPSTGEGLLSSINTNAALRATATHKCIQKLAEYVMSEHAYFLTPFRSTTSIITETTASITLLLNCLII
jgi:hypothetical protein